MKTIIKLLKKDWLWLVIILPIVITTLFWLAVFKGHAYYERQLATSFEDGWEVGYMQGQIDQDLINSNECFNISKNVELNQLLKKYFKDCKLAKTMWAIAQAESSGKQFAVGQNDNGSLDGGWLQVNSIHKKKTETKQEFINRVHDLEENIKEARKVYDKQGLKAWVTYNNKKYLTYLK